MSQIRVKEFDVVRLKDGREGTVVHIYHVPGLPLAYEIEFGSRMQLETVEAGEIDKVIWTG